MAARFITANVQGGKALARHLGDIEKSLGHGANVQIGFLASATYPASHASRVSIANRKPGQRFDVTRQSDAEFKSSYASGSGALHVATVAFWNEFGTTKTPSRPFFRTMITNKSPRWGVSLGNILRKQNYDAERSLALMGEGIRGQLRQSIVEWSSPPNAPFTVERKGFNKPLIDTAVMLRSIDYQVIHGGATEDD